MFYLTKKQFIVVCIAVFRTPANAAFNKHVFY